MKRKTKTREYAYCLRHFVPRLAHSIHGRTGEGGAHLQHTVQIVQTSTNVGDGRPLLDGSNTRRNGGPI